MNFHCSPGLRASVAALVPLPFRISSGLAFARHLSLRLSPNWPVSTLGLIMSNPPEAACIYNYPAGYFFLRESLGPPIGLMFELYDDTDFTHRQRAAFKSISLQMVALVDDDELGLVGASLEDRVRLALSVKERRDER